MATSPLSGGTLCWPFDPARGSSGRRGRPARPPAPAPADLEAASASDPPSCQLIGTSARSVGGHPPPAAASRCGHLPDRCVAMARVKTLSLLAIHAVLRTSALARSAPPPSAFAQCVAASNCTIPACGCFLCGGCSSEYCACDTCATHITRRHVYAACAALLALLGCCWFCCRYCCC